MRYLWTILLCLVAGSLLAAETNVVMYMEVLRDDGSTSRQRIILDDWEVDNTESSLPRIKMRKLEVTTGGIDSRGKIRSHNADIETDEPDYGFVAPVSNAQYGASRWLLNVNQTGEEVAGISLIKLPPQAQGSAVRIMSEDPGRAALVASNQAARAQMKVDFDQAGQLQQKVDIIAEWVGLKDPE